MPVKIEKTSDGKVRVSTPNGVKAKSTSMEKAKRLERLLNAVEHSDWRPSRKSKSGGKVAKP